MQETLLSLSLALSLHTTGMNNCVYTNGMWNGLISTTSRLYAEARGFPRPRNTKESCCSVATAALKVLSLRLVYIPHPLRPIAK